MPQIHLRDVSERLPFFWSRFMDPNPVICGSLSPTWERTEDGHWSHERRLSAVVTFLPLVIPRQVQTFSNGDRLHMVASSPEAYFTRMCLDVISQGQSTHGKFTDVARNVYVYSPHDMAWWQNHLWLWSYQQRCAMDKTSDWCQTCMK